MQKKSARLPRLPVAWGLLLAIVAIAWAAIFVRWCEDTPALVIAFYRMLWSTIIIAVLSANFRRRGGVAERPTLKQGLLIAAAGFMLALHFVTWIASVKLTIIAHATMLSSIHPALALLLAPLLFKEKAGLKSALAVFLTLAGMALIAGQDLLSAGGRITGDLLAVASAVFITFYLFSARYLRNSLSLLPYLLRVYGFSAVALLVMCLIAGHPLIGHGWQAHLFMLLLAAVPTGIGHSLLNWASRKIPVLKVNIAALGEPILAAALAFPIFGELPYGWFYPGAVLVVGGILLALLEK